MACQVEIEGIVCPSPPGAQNCRQEAYEWRLRGSLVLDRLEETGPLANGPCAAFVRFGQIARWRRCNVLHAVPRCRSPSNRRHGPYQRTDELKEDVGGKDEEPDTQPKIDEQVFQ